MGRSIADRPVEIRELTGESGLVVVQGEIFHLEQKELKGGETLLVREQIRASDGSRLTDVPSWFWSALLGRTKGPWLVTTVVESDSK